MIRSVLTRAKDLADKYKREVVEWHGMEVVVELKYEPWFLGRNWKVGITMFKPPIVPVYSKEWRFWRYESALKTFNEIVENLKNPKVVKVTEGD